MKNLLLGALCVLVSAATVAAEPPVVLTFPDGNVIDAQHPSIQAELRFSQDVSSYSVLTLVAYPDAIGWGGVSEQSPARQAGEVISLPLVTRGGLADGEYEYIVTLSLESGGRFILRHPVFVETRSTITVGDGLTFTNVSFRSNTITGVAVEEVRENEWRFQTVTWKLMTSDDNTPTRPLRSRGGR